MQRRTQLCCILALFCPTRNFALAGVIWLLAVGVSRFPLTEDREISTASYVGSTSCSDVEDLLTSFNDNISYGSAGIPVMLFWLQKQKDDSQTYARTYTHAYANKVLTLIWTAAVVGNVLTT